MIPSNIPSWAKVYKEEETALVDSAASLTLLHSKAPANIAKKQEPNKQVTIPNGSHMRTTKTLQLALSSLPQAATRGYRMPEILHNLVAVAELCEAGCTVTFTKEGVEILHGGRTCVRGWRDTPTRLWRIPIVDKSTPKVQLQIEHSYANAAVQLSTPDYTVHLANSVYDCNTQQQLILYYHAALFSPTKTSLIKAARQGFL